MPSPTETRALRSHCMWTGALLLSLCMPLQAQEAGPSPEQVRTAVQQVREDPLWSQKKKEHTLRFKPQKDPDKKEAPNKPVENTGNFLRTLSEAGRALVWILGAICVAWILVGMRRWIRLRDKAMPIAPEILPSHVSRLDIRPQSLPDRIGDAAYRLWQEGAHHRALSLLYRGTLSRLVHQHAVPIQAASTEEECVALASTRLDSQRNALVKRLVGVWQVATYGDQLPGTETMEDLCNTFERLLGATATQRAAA